METFEVYAVRYGHHATRRADENFITSDDHQSLMPMDFFVWLIRGPHHTYLVDTGFDAEIAARRKRELVRPVADGLAVLGVRPDEVRDIIVTHMHYDHAGNHELFPNARYHIQAREMEYCTGPCMCHASIRHPFEVTDVQAMVGKLFEGRVTFHAGESEITPGLSVHWVGGHSRGLQIIRVLTRRGWVVLAGDASHYYENFEQRRPFPIVANTIEMLDGYDTLYRLAETGGHIVPGHDPKLLTRYPAHGPVRDIVRVDLDPIG